MFGLSKSGEFAFLLMPKKSGVLPPLKPKPPAPLDKGLQSIPPVRPNGSLYKVILVPIDFSESSNRTFQFATHIAVRENANI
jgi:hypothetical protein